MKHFDVEELLEAARRYTGLSDFGPTDFLKPLGVLVEGLNTEAGIAPDRFDALHERLVRLLVNRAWFARDLARHPEILEEDLGTPVVISTLPRTGSTKLHRLLAASGDFQTLSFWKVHMPSRIPAEADGGVARRVAETREFERWMYETSPAVLTGHPQFTDEAEECQWLMEGSFRHPIQFGLFESSRYLQWLMQADMRPTFDYFRQQLQYLQWQFPADRGKPWLIKSPTHFGNEHHLQRIFDDLRLVVTHRDPGKAITSIASTSMSVRRLYSDVDSGAAMAANAVSMFSFAASEHMRWRDTNTQVAALDLAFREVSDDGVATARNVYDFLGMTMSHDAESRMRAWEKGNGREKHGRAQYSATDYGLTEDAIRQPFSAYIERFAAYLP